MRSKRKWLASVLLVASALVCLVKDAPVSAWSIEFPGVGDGNTCSDDQRASGGCIMFFAWVKGTGDLGLSEISSCGSNEAYALVKIMYGITGETVWTSGYEAGISMAGANSWGDISSTWGRFHIPVTHSISSGGSGDNGISPSSVVNDVLSGTGFSYVSYSSAESAYGATGQTLGFNASSSLTAFCSGGTQTQTPTPTPTPTPMPEETPEPVETEGKDTATATINFDVQVKKYNGSEAVSGDRVEVHGWDPVDVYPTFEYCMSSSVDGPHWNGEGASPGTPSGSSRWNTGSITGGGEGTGSGTASSGCFTRTTATRKTVQGQTVSFCQNYGYDRSLSFINTRTKTDHEQDVYRTERVEKRDASGNLVKDASGNQVYEDKQVYDHTDKWTTYGGWEGWRMTGRDSSGGGNNCINFFQPYRYEDYENTYTGNVTGRLTPKVTNYSVSSDCQSDSVANEGTDASKDCFIKSSVSEGSNAPRATNVKTDSNVGENIDEQFKDVVTMTGKSKKSSDQGGIRGYETNKWDGKSFSGNEPTTQWMTNGIEPTAWTDLKNPPSGGTMKDFSENTRSVGALGYHYLNQYNQLIWYGTVKWVLRSDGLMTLDRRLDKSSASVSFNIYHPYNYNSSVKTPTLGDDNLYVGGQGTAKVGASYFGRVNNPVAGNSSYQTALPTKAGRYYAVFTVPEDKGSDVVSGLLTETLTKRNGGNYDDLCKAMGNLGGAVSECESNKLSTLSGDAQVSFNVPDEVGVKICVISGVNYSDSHQKPGEGEEEISSPEDDKKGVSTGTADGDVVANVSRSEVMINSDYWRISPVACETVKAKPKFQTWNAGFYTEGVVKMSIDIKVPDQQFSLAP